MRIIDKNRDFYDYLQSPTDTLVFDRRNSFLMTKDGILRSLAYSKHTRNNIYDFILVQACNTFWLILIEINKYEEEYFGESASDFSSELLCSWKNYNKPRKRLDVQVVSFDPFTMHKLWKKCDRRIAYIPKEHFHEYAHTLQESIDYGKYNCVLNLSRTEISTSYRSGWKHDTKDIPLLKASGLQNSIDPVELFSSIEEFFSLEKQSSERTESIGLTDKDKIQMHGFDLKNSFRGKGTCK